MSSGAWGMCPCLSPWRGYPYPGGRPQLPRNLLHLLEKGLRLTGRVSPGSHPLSAENCSHLNPAGSPGLAGSWGSPFQQLRSLSHSHPSLQLVELMKSPQCHRSRRELLRALSSRRQTARQGVALASCNRRPPEALEWAVPSRSGPRRSRLGGWQRGKLPGLLTPATTYTSEA